MFSRNASKNKSAIKSSGDYSVALVGNPNVGKSTVFNLLTGMKQHTGNWTGKTVDNACGKTVINGKTFDITDLPGTYSLLSFSGEEETAAQYLRQSKSDCLVIVMDSNVPERNLAFVLQVLSIEKNAVICLNMCDEARKNGIVIDAEKLSEIVGVPVVRTCAAKGKGTDKLKEEIYNVCTGKSKCTMADKLYEGLEVFDPLRHGKTTLLLAERSKKICEKCVSCTESTAERRANFFDRLLTSKLTGIPIMLLTFGLLFWITAVGANYPSEWLGAIFGIIKEQLYKFADFINTPEFIKGLFIDGIYTTLSWVVSVMLPPMAIFFPLFSIIEDSGFLPRIAFNLDKFFSKCGANGKQSLTMAMGMGCNACGVTGCRIIDSPRERFIAIQTNNLMPCNGRLPMLAALIMMLVSAASLGGGSIPVFAAALMLVFVLCIGATFLTSKILSLTIAKGESSGFVLELPPYRKPQIIKTVVRSFFDRTIFVLGRAVAVAAPAGALIWLAANVDINGMSILKYCTDFLDPFGRFIGLDGVIIMAFILGFPANETVIPIMIMAYTANGTLTDYSSYSELFRLFTENGWTCVTVICTIIMCVMHFPCSTTVLTIKKETGSISQTLLAVLLPTAMGIMLCTAAAAAARLI